MAEVAGVHRDLYAEHGELYGEGVATKIERCLAVSDAEADAARAARRDVRARGARGARGRRPAADADADVRRAARGHRRARVARPVRALHVPVQRARLAGARAAVRRRRGRAARVGAARRPARATTRWCSRPGSRSRGRSREPDADLAFAHRLADAADAITLARFRARDLVVETKPDLTPVAEADRAAEDGDPRPVAASGRARACSARSSATTAAATRWIVDPIDGTMNYVRGMPVWATLLALEQRRPGRGRRSCRRPRSAAAGGRCAARARGPDEATGALPRLAVARIEDCAASTTSPRELPPGWAELVAPRVGDPRPERLLAALPRRRGRARRRRRPRIVALWDYAAIALVVEEAGGRCTTFEGGEPTPEGSLLSTNGALHDAASALLHG